MKIAVLFPMDSPQMSWNLGRGLVATLERMGIQTLPIPLPTLREASQHQFDEAKRLAPPLAMLKACDAVITTGPEHIGPWIEAMYERYEWRGLGIPTAAWMHESTEREDYSVDFESIEWIGHDWFFPAIQDAEKFDQEMFVQGRSHYLPFGVDAEMFQPIDSRADWTSEYAEFGIAFMGLLYPKRIAFLQAVSKHQHPPIRMGTVMIQDLRGYQHEEATRRYVENLHSIKVFLNLPTLSRLLVTKVYEVLACGGFLLTPELPPDGGVARNMAAFESGKHLIYYRSSHTPYVAQLLREWSSPEFAQRRDAIAVAGCLEVRKKHSLEVRLTELLTKMGIEVKQAVQ
jgi:hypothetical protein